MKLITALGLALTSVFVIGCQTDREVITPGKTIVVHDKAAPATVIVKQAPTSSHTENDANVTSPTDPSNPPDPDQQTTTTTTTTGN